MTITPTETSRTEAHERWQRGGLTPVMVRALLSRCDRSAAAAWAGFPAHVFELWAAGQLYPSWGALGRIASGVGLDAEAVFALEPATVDEPGDIDGLLARRYDQGLVALTVEAGDEYPELTSERQELLGRTILTALGRAAAELSDRIAGDPDGPLAEAVVRVLRSRHAVALRALREALFGGDVIAPRSRAERRRIERGVMQDADDSAVPAGVLGPFRAATQFGTHVAFSLEVHRVPVESSGPAPAIEVSCTDHLGSPSPVERLLWWRALLGGSTCDPAGLLEVDGEPELGADGVLRGRFVLTRPGGAEEVEVTP
ncbi:hypothetical protein KXS11_01960 [Plantibacter flavus]|uniref:hypothetical protein n=1 Tax=Plantibacter flavus TaxID=150123 RepID=UPI003F16AABE